MGGTWYGWWYLWSSSLLILQVGGAPPLQKWEGLSKWVHADGTWWSSSPLISEQVGGVPPLKKWGRLSKWVLGADGTWWSSSGRG